MAENIPTQLQRKMVLDSFIELETSKPVVDFVDYKRLKREQQRAYKECEKLYFPSKSKD